jgi:3-oxoacyl-[acyl-carrier-protein] synthase II
MSNRIAVTGRGILTSNAASLPEFAQALRSGRSGIGPLTLLDPAPYYCSRIGEVHNLAEDLRTPRGRVFRMLRAAVDQAVGEASDSWLRQNAGRTGIVVGSTSGGIDAKERLIGGWHVGHADAFEPELERELLDEAPFEALTEPIAREYGLSGPMATTSVACTSGGSAVGLALSLIASGDATAMIAAACETASQTAYGGFSAVRAMAQETCRPFDRERDGMLIGEGAAALVLEPTEQAAARGAHVFAEVLGFGCCNDAYHSVTPHPKGEGLAASVLQALAAAAMSPNDVDLICAHGTATTLNDDMERAAYHSVFGERVSEIPVMAVKPILGHTLGAAGAVELMATICALDGGFVPPILGHRSPNDGCPLWLVRDRAIEREMRVAVCCNAAFAGNNSALVVSRGQS